MLWDSGEDGTVKRQLLRMYASGTTNTQDEDYLPLIDGHAKYTPSRGNDVTVPVGEEYLPDDDADPELGLVYYGPE